MMANCIYCDREILTSTESVEPRVECKVCYDFSLCNAMTSWENDDDPDDIDLDAMPYSKYLKSEHWQTARLLKIKSEGGHCAFCKSTLLLHVHHREYPKLRRELTPNMLVVLCKRCQGLLHGEK